MEPLETEIQVLLLKNNKYIIAEVEQLDEEPSCYLKNCFEITNEGYYDNENRTPHEPPKNGVLMNERHYEEDWTKDDGEVKMVKYADYEYAVLEKFPRYAPVNECLIYSNEIFTVFDPLPEILELYNTLKN
jgi:small nuclear ribonucleoprotein (snRNP)-like protein